MIIGKKVSKPELAVEALSVESNASVVAEPAVKPLDFEVCFHVVIDDSSVCRHKQMQDIMAL